MILSVSRRTDIPAFYSDWFMDKIEKREVMVRNPMFPQKVSKINISPDVIDCIVFWTKDAKPILKNLDKLNNYNYYFQYTLNAYGKDLEPSVPNKGTELISTFIELSNKIGAEKVIWRYDPILISQKYTVDYHINYFEKLAKKLHKFTNQCIFSFIDIYSKNEVQMNKLGIREPNKQEMELLAKSFSQICKKYNLKLSTCSEEIDLEKYNISHASCIDKNLIEDIFNIQLKVNKDKSQRKICGCVSSVDIGVYNTCTHYCHYCYANSNKKNAYNNALKHIVESPLLIGKLKQDDVITERKMISLLK